MRRLFQRLVLWKSFLAERAQPFLLLGIRLFWGYQFFLAGRGKLLNIDRTASFFQSLEIPLPMLNAYAAGMTECFGGLLLLIGFGTRLVSIPLIFTMLVAYATAHRTELLGIVSNPDGFVSAPPFLFLYAATIALVFGPGWISVDGWYGRSASGPRSMTGG